MTRILFRCAALVAVVLMMGSCGTFPWFHHEKAAPSASTEAAAAPKTVQDHENDLRTLVTAEVERAGKSAGAAGGQVIKRKPYFYRTYDVYPEGASNLKVSMQETQSRSVPYMADVTVAKQRYATRLHRKRGEAEKDANFLRDTGTETATYELRSGKWTRAGSMFVANKSEENVNGEWLPVDETVKRTVQEEESKAKGGWLKRTWASITGKEVDEKPTKEADKSKKPKGTPAGSQSTMSRMRGF